MLIPLRLAVWYVVITALFRCPSARNDLDQSSPWVCKPYLTARSYIQPHVQPYYDSYASPYIETARPYAQQLHDHVIRPASTFATDSYGTYAAPHVEQAASAAQAQWDKVVMPQFLWVQKEVNNLYDKNIAPHISTASSFVGPYYKTARDNAIDLHHNYIRPTLAYSSPYLQRSFTASEDFLLHTVVPQIRNSWSTLIIFVDSTFWPTVKGLYRDNVRPQIVLITERIAKYQEGRKLRAAMAEVDSSMEEFPSPTSSVTSASTVAPTTESEIIVSPTTARAEDTAPAPIPPEPKQTVATEEQIAADLRTWQEKFAIAADKGSDDLAERINDMVRGLIRSDVDGEGKGLATALKRSVDKHMNDVKAKIKKVVAALPDDASAHEIAAAEAEILESIRASGHDIRSRANQIRQWFYTFDTEIQKRASAALHSTLDVLDSIRDLGLQEIGMRWAWMDGVTYKHWAKYHELKKQLDEWRSEVRDVAMKHPALEEAKSVSEAILEEAMDLAADSAKELLRLKDVAKWKIIARDASNDFDTRVLPAAAVSAASSLAEKVKAVTEAVLGSSQGKPESLTSLAKEKVEAASSSASTAIDESVSAATSLAAEAKESVRSGVTVITDLLQAAVEAMSPADSKSPLTSLSSLVPEATESATDSAQSVTSTVSGKLFAGAMAQDVKGQIPILDDVFDSKEDSAFSDDLQSIVNEAGDRYAAVTKAVSEAMFGTRQGTIESMASVASDVYSSALAAASSALYGPEQGATERIASIASDKYAQAVVAASAIIYGTPTPVTVSLMSQASVAYSDAVSRAREFYEQANSVVSQHILGTPKPIHEQMFASIESAYSGALAAASARLDDAREAVAGQYSAVSASMSSLSAKATPGSLDAVSSMAASKLEDALKFASAQYSSAKAAVGATPTPQHQQYLNEARRNYYEAVGFAHEQYSEFLNAASQAVYGKPTPVLHSWAGVASEALVGTPVPAYQTMIDAAHIKFEAASAAAASHFDVFLSSVQSVASQATGTTGPAQSLLDEASAQYSAALLAASASLSAASHAASEAIYGTPAPAYQQALDVASEKYSAATAAAAAHMAGLLAAASSAVGTTTKSPAQSVLDNISAQYKAAVDAASSSLSAASYSASTAIYGPPRGSVESAARVASANWEALVSQASEKIYGQPTPVYASLASQATEYASQVTEAAASQYAVIQAFVSELIVGKEPDFTESVMSRLSTAFYHGYHVTLASSASSLASEVYESASSVVSSVSSVASSYFTPPPEFTVVLDSVNDQFNSIVDAASVQIYGTEKGAFERATSALGDTYASAASAASDANYGTPPSYAEIASASISEVVKSAQDALSVALYGTPTGPLEAATIAAAHALSQASSVLADSYESVAAAAGEYYDTAAAKVSEAVYGPEQSALESAHRRVAEAASSAHQKIAAMASQAAEAGSDAIDAAKSNAASAASEVSSALSSVARDVSSAVSSAASRVRDEL